MNCQRPAERPDASSYPGSQPRQCPVPKRGVIDTKVAEHLSKSEAVLPRIGLGRFRFGQFAANIAAGQVLAAILQQGGRLRGKIEVCTRHFDKPPVVVEPDFRHAAAQQASENSRSFEKISRSRDGVSI